MQWLTVECRHLCLAYFQLLRLPQAQQLGTLVLRGIRCLGLQREPASQMGCGVENKHDVKVSQIFTYIAYICYWLSIHRSISKFDIFMDYESKHLAGVDM